MQVRPVGFRQLQQQLSEIAERGGDPTPAFREIGDLFREAQADNFARGGRPKWKPVSPELAARKARESRGTKVGVYTGGLRASLTNLGDPRHIQTINADGMKVGTKNPVANLFGGKHTQRQQPRRKTITLTPAMRRYYLQIVQDYLLEGRLP